MADATSPSRKEIPIAKQKIPPPQIQLQLEIECYKRLLNKLERDKKSSGDEAMISIMWNEVSTRMKMYDTLMGQNYASPPDSLRMEKVALAKLFLALHGHAWSRKLGWVGQPKILKKPEILMFEAETSVFEGIELTDVGIGTKSSYVVTSMQLQGIGATGQMPVEICDISNIQNLFLDHNLISGDLPIRMSRLQSLKRLCLRSNRLSGPFAESFLSSLTELLILDVSCNNLSGYLPDTFDGLKNLSTLNMSHNAFEGELPSSLSKLARLRILKLSNNSLCGQLPDWMSALTQLREFHCANNRLTGGLAALTECRRLETLVLNDNCLLDDIGADPQTLEGMPWDQLVKLKTLYLHRNKLVGNFSFKLSWLHQIERINLSNNDLHGALPDSIGSMTALTTLLLSGNRFVGPVPLSLASLDKLRDFSLFRGYPAMHSVAPRGFKRRQFERVYSYGPSTGINATNWDLHALYGEGARPEDVLSTVTMSLAESSTVSVGASESMSTATRATARDKHLH